MTVKSSQIQFFDLCVHQIARRKNKNKCYTIKISKNFLQWENNFKKCQIDDVWDWENGKYDELAAAL